MHITHVHAYTCFTWGLHGGVGLSSPGVLPGGFCLKGFVRGDFCPFPICQNTTITTESETSLSISGFICMMQKFKSVTSHALDPLPPISQTVTPSRTIPFSSVTYFMNGPIYTGANLKIKFCIQSAVIYYQIPIIYC